ncbi:CoA transferase [Thalassotalea sp. G2M2-11]|uniref:CaiB/BaiF CoA transferase family protein n=1 Tax=Thalassotalea sp. G2M2-11 TaxID=2787627 RepID=UPI0019D220DD|nr:CoA transferase [Thalassotalea sp. G2M2-11]
MEDSSTTAEALQGIKVLDLSRILAGPWASQMLADLGAEVIKVERPQVGDDTRFWGPPFVVEASGQQPPQAAYYHCANRNKKSIAIDITTEQGQKIIRELVCKVDVVIENFKVGGLAKYGLDYPTLKKLNPELVYCSITGYGQSGPYAHKAGYDAMIQAEGGLMSLTGEPEGDPMKVGVAVVDIMTGLYSCNAILAALMARHHTKRGQYIDMALLDVQFATLANQSMNYLTTHETPDRYGNGHPNIVPYQCFATKDGNLMLAIGNDQQFKRFCQLAQLSELAQDQRYATNEQRVNNRAELIDILTQKLHSQTTAWWISQLEKISVPCGAVNDLAQVCNHPQIQNREMIKQLPNINNVLVNSVASPINLSDTPIKYHHAAPELGQHTYEVLTSTLAYDETTIRTLYHHNIIA